LPVTAGAKVNFEKQIEFIKDIYTVSAKLGLKTYFWGGFAVDILNGSLTREHGDIDAFTENLVENKDRLIAEYKLLGYTLEYYLDEFWMLCLKKDGVSATFNTVKNIDGIAHWHHAGQRGTVFFPHEWLDETPTDFYGAPAYTCGIELAYLLKTNVKLISAEWQLREKDRADIAVLERILAAKGVDVDAIKKKVWSFNPYWYGKGYGEYFFPVGVV
jgi:hypothetical protein